MGALLMVIVTGGRLSSGGPRVRGSEGPRVRGSEGPRVRRCGAPGPLSDSIHDPLPSHGGGAASARAGPRSFFFKQPFATLHHDRVG